MSSLEFRPRFRFHSALSIEEIADRMKGYHAQLGDQSILLKKVKNHLVVDIAPDYRHFWSPHMDVNLEHDDDVNMTQVRCLIGPAPTVWTMFMFFYGFFGFMSFVGLTLGLSQWTLRKPMWGFWFLPIALIGMAMMYFISFEGKKLAHDDMRRLKKFLDDALGCDCFALAEEQRID